MQLEIMHFLPSDMRSVVLHFYKNCNIDSLVVGYGDEGATIDMMPED
jgi:hypothetical protein